MILVKGMKVFAKRAKYIPMLSVGATFFFTIMMFNVPLPDGTTAHAVGAALPLAMFYQHLHDYSKLVQLKLNIGASGGEFTPPEVETRGTPTCRSGRLDVE